MKKLVEENGYYGMLVEINADKRSIEITPLPTEKDATDIKELF
jgi:hypothetical protein